MRNDAIGFFWNDTPPPKPPKKEAEKRIPPKKTWLEPGYLPGLEEARRFPVHVMSLAELAQAQQNREELVLDVEVYPNYFLIVFMSIQTGWVFYLEMVEDESELNTDLFLWILKNFQTIGFNSKNFDLPICFLAIKGCSTRQLKTASDMIILQGFRGYEVLKEFKTKSLVIDHIDLIEIAPLFGSLKTYGARMHVPKLQDLPFHPDTCLTEDQITCTRWYCVNDTVVTAYLKQEVQEHIDLRVRFGQQYNADFRSLSDSQMAQKVIDFEIKKVTGQWPKRPIPGQSVGQRFCYRPPSYITFQTPELQKALWEMSNAVITVGVTGHAECPEGIRQRTVVIAGRPYKVGMGGLHSQEKAQALISNERFEIFDRDVTGYYPNLILKNRFAPPHLGNSFLTPFQEMVNRRTDAKHLAAKLIALGVSKDDQRLILALTEASGLKISNNGIFGKLSDPFSTVYDVPNMVQVTITGQLSLLMIIELLELNRIPVVSANTDGIVAACPVGSHEFMKSLFKAWEQRTGLETEETKYKAVYSANVNNYIAIKPDGKTKVKGWYSERGSAHNSILAKNPETLICSDAIQAYLSKGVPYQKTILECKDIRRFVSVRQVKGGGVKVWGEDNTEYLGKAVRWYYAKDVPGEIVYASSGNKVPKTDGAKPLMQLPKTLPDDIDYDWYIAKAESMLCDLGVWKRAK
jgi:hypothetical protein